jgi:hypothetical protein
MKMQEFWSLMWNRKTLRVAALAVCLCISSAWCEEPTLNLFTAIDAGRIENGFDMRDNYDPSGLMLLRNYVNVGYTHQLDERNMISMGVGGIFWKSYEVGGAAAGDKTIKFGPGLSHAYMKYTISENMDLTYGFLNYKYNSAAKNLGEYLFRTEAYPTIVYTGGWSWLNSAGYSTVGGQFSWTLGDGAFNQDLVLFMEYFNSPIYDLTPAYIATWKPAPAFTLGGAISLHRLITPTPGTKNELTKSFEYYKDLRLQAESQAASFHINDQTGYYTSRDYTANWDYGTALDTTATKQAIWENDSTYYSIYVSTAQDLQLELDTVLAEGRPGILFSGLRADLEEVDSAAYYDTNFVNVPPPQTVSFDLSTTKLVCFFELDIRALLDKAKEDMGDFNLYGEVALVGTKNYPVFYTEYSQRLATMLGVSIPVPYVFDHLSLEMEYLKNPIVESIYSTYDQLKLVPDEKFRTETFTADDIKWTIHASRAINNYFTIYVQIANDHFRPKNAFAQPMYIPVTNEKGHWYWLTRLQWSI